MHQVSVQLNDQLFAEAKRRAIELGFRDVQAYVAEVIQGDLAGQSQSLDHLFTPELLKLIDESKAQVEDGKALPFSKAQAELENRRAEWLRSNEA